MAHREYHATLGVYIKDFIYGANDGIITTFAIVTGASGAGFSPLVVIVLGFANLFADGFSMAASNYLGSSSEAALFREEEKREIREVEEKPDVEREEVREISTATKMTETIASNKNFWVDFMMRYEVEMLPGESSIKSAVITFCAFVVIGSLPLLPFIILSANGITIFYSVISTGVALFVTGALRSIFTKKHWFISGLEMFFIGGVAAAVSYFVGYGLKLLVG